MSKRGKVSSRQDPAQQFKQLQQEEASYVQARLASNPSSQQQQQGSSAAGPAAAADDDDDYGGSSTAAMPQQVTDRMLKRILICSGLPVATGILLFPFFYFLKVRSTGLPGMSNPGAMLVWNIEVAAHVHDLVVS